MGRPGFERLLCIWFLAFGLTLQIVAEEMPQPRSYARKVTAIDIIGNHQTNLRTILTELPFQLNWLIHESDIPQMTERARQNLLNTSLFNFVEINIIYPDRHSVDFLIKVEERWYIWAFPLFEQEARNFSDFLRLNDGAYINYGVYFKHDNFRGRRESLKLRLLTGYRNQILFDFQKPSLNQRSGWGFTTSWLIYDQTAYSTVHDKQVFLKTLGNRLLEQTSFHLNYSYRYQLDHLHSIKVGITDTKASDTLLIVNPNFLPEGKTHSRAVDISYRYSWDRRDSKVYPLSGNSYEVGFSRRGLEIDTEYDGFFQGDLIASFQYPLARRLYSGSRVLMSAIDKREVPYVFRTGLGYKDYLNGFEYRVIDGSSFGAIQNKFLYELIPRREKNIRWVPLPQFSRIHYSVFAKLHLDAGYVVNDNQNGSNNMANTLLLGYGFGLDMVTFYDKVLSLNYSFNNFGEHSIFVHFNLAM